METYNDMSQSKNINSHLEVARELTSNLQIQRTTKVTYSEVGKLGVIVALAQMQDTYRRKYLNLENPCFLTNMLDSNFKLRMSETGWRAGQIENIAKSPKIEESNMNDKPKNLIGARI